MENELLRYIDNAGFNAVLSKAARRFADHAKTVLIIEPYGSSIALLLRGLESGLNIILLTANSDLRKISATIIQSVQLAVEVDTANESVLFKLVDELRTVFKIDAVIPGFEYFVPAAARLANYLGLPGINAVNIPGLRNKAVMRTRLASAGIALPAFVVVNTAGELQDAIRHVGFPAVCKPVDAAGSVHVRRVNNEIEAEQAASCILHGKHVLWGYQLANQLLYEEYVSGKEYSVEGTVTNGNILYFSITEKFLADQSEFVEIGHVVNTPISAELKRKIMDYLNDVISVLQPDYCPFHAEIRMTREGEPVLMEIAARLAGDKIGDLINISYGINYYDYIYAAYFGEVQSLPDIEGSIAGIRFFYRPQISSFVNVPKISMLPLDSDISCEEIKFYYQPNQPIPAFPKPLRRLGHVIVKCADYERLLRTLNDIDQAAKFQV